MCVLTGSLQFTFTINVRPMVKFTHFLMFLVTFKLLVNFGVQAQPVPPFKFFWFSLTWPSSLCNDNTGCRDKPPPDFTIHGLWPDNFDGPPLSECTAQPYVPMKNKKLYKLQWQWPNLRAGGGKVFNERFWTYEWNKHGVCALYFYDQNSYFLLASRLKDRFKDVLKELGNNGIVPGRGKPFSLNKIRNILKGMTKMDPDLACNYDHQGNYQLFEVRFCIDADGQTIVNCPADRSSYTCSGTGSAMFPLAR